LGIPLAAILVILDRGYEAEALVLADIGVHIIATSQKGSKHRHSTPFTYDSKPLSENAKKKMEVLEYKGAANSMMTMWRENAIGRTKFFHLALFHKKGKPPVLMKTTNPELVNLIMVVPKRSSDKLIVATNENKARIAEKVATRDAPVDANQASITLPVPEPLGSHSLQSQLPSMPQPPHSTSSTITTTSLRNTVLIDNILAKIERLPCQEYWLC
jgi:hypothetical protein